ncbi:hypothetical protein [Sinomonas humi]|uniref:hypothetical protein n=1 Tax=Sinomonas humi TaxID=1338436 RepID=UPI0012E078D1|nr:hypothetical protein [Sinomonas humi]
MAIIHEATLVPGKLELLNAWLPRQPWAAHADVPSGAELSPDAELDRLGTYRFDDPEGL